jgi:hypothetical protein
MQAEKNSITEDAITHANCITETPDLADGNIPALPATPCGPAHFGVFKIIAQLNSCPATSDTLIGYLKSPGKKHM